MTYEFTTHEHIGADGALHLTLSNEWAHKDVTVTVEVETPEDVPLSGTLAEALAGYIGTASFEVPDDIHERHKEIYAESLAAKYERKTQ